MSLNLDANLNLQAWNHKAEWNIERFCYCYYSGLSRLKNVFNIFFPAGELKIQILNTKAHIWTLISLERVYRIQKTT